MPKSTLHLFAICVLIWGSTWIAITFQLGAVAPAVSVGYRFLLAALILFGFCWARKMPLAFTRAQHLDLALFGLTMFCVSYILVYYAELYIVSGMVAVAYSASPLLTMVAARVLFGTPMTRSVTVGALFGVAGIVCVFWHEFSKLSASRDAELGTLLTILSVVASALGSMAALRTQARGYPTWTSMAWGMFYGGVGAILFALITGKSFQIDLQWTYLAALVYLAVAGSIITFACYLTLIKRIGAAKASYVGVMVPIVALVFSFFFEKFAWGWLTTLGVALSLVGNVVMLKKRESTSLEAPKA